MSKNAEPALLTALKHNDPSVRWEAIYEIGKLEDLSGSVLAILQKIVKNDNQENAAIARKTLIRRSLKLMREIGPDKELNRKDFVNIFGLKVENEVKLLYGIDKSAMEDQEELRLQFAKYSVYQILSAFLKVDANNISNSTHVADDLGADSFDVIEILMFFEQNLDIEITDDEIEGIETIGEAVHFIKKKIFK